MQMVTIISLFWYLYWQQDPDPKEQQNFYTDNSLKQDPDP